MHTIQDHSIKSLSLIENLSLKSAMAFPAAFFVVPLGVLFLFSGLIVNLIQAFFFLTVWPFSKNTYRRINSEVAQLLWLEFIWLADWWAGVKIELYTDAETFDLMGKEHALIICNHKSDVDWLIGWILAQRSGCLGSAVPVTKKAAKFLPVVGWSIWFSGAIFLERSWLKDEKTLKFGFQRLRDFPIAFWMALFVEGTRFTQAKLLAAQEYASSMGLPSPRNVLIPRTKGFVTAVSQMHEFVPAVYDLTYAFSKGSPPPTMLRLLKRQPSVVHVHMKRHLMKDLPKTDDAVAQWCRDVFLAKDKLLDKHKADGNFGDGELQIIGRPLKSLVVVTSWACLLIFASFKFLQWTSLLSSWKGLTFSAIGLAIVTVLMQFMIQFTQSERSNPANLSKHPKSS